MHGLIHQRLKSYVVDKTDETSWRTILEHSGIDPQLYLPVSHYPDEEVRRILETLAELSGHDVSAIERDFGRTLAPALLQTFRAHWREEWTLLELLEHTNDIAKALRAKHPANDPPAVSCRRTDDGHTVIYRSQRGYPAMAHGVLEGLAREFDESVTIRRMDTETVDGETRCTFHLEGLED